MAKDKEKDRQIDEATYEMALNRLNGVSGYNANSTASTGINTGARPAAQPVLEEAIDEIEEAESPATGGASSVTGDSSTGAAATINGRPVYTPSFDEQLDELFQRISNREPFQYDVKTDPLYQGMKDEYIQNGKLAMRDSMGQAAALTGGYGSTYGQQVGQQTYDAYLQNLSAVIPELYSMAYDMYKDKGDDLLTQYGLLGDMRDIEYNRWRDELSDWNYDQEVARQQEETEYNRRRDEDNTAYSRRQQAYSNLVALIKASGYVPTDDELEAAGLTRESAEAIRQEYQRNVDIDAQNLQLKIMAAMGSGGSSGGGSGGGGGGGSGSGYDASVAAIQQQLNAMGAGLAVDGIWGPLTQAAYDRLMGGGGGGNYTRGTIADLYQRALEQGNQEDAMKAVNYGVEEGIITPEERKLILKDYRLRDRL